MKHPILLVLLSFIFTVSYAQKPGKQSLIAAEYRVDSSGVGNFAYLVAYNFVNGVFVSKDTIIGLPTSVEGRKGQCARYDLGRNFIYQNRYVISGVGNVIDTKTRSLVIEDSDEFIEAKGDTLVFYHHSAFNDRKGFLHLVLSKRTYHHINHDELDRDQRISPGKDKSVYIDRSKLPYKIVLNTTSVKNKIIVSDAGTGPNHLGGGINPTICTYWLNNHTIIYTIHQKKQRYSLDSIVPVVLRKYNTITGKDDQFAIIDSVRSSPVNDRVYKDEIGNLVYQTADGKHFLIDTITYLLSPYTAYEMGHGFSHSFPNREYGQKIFYFQKEIGSIWGIEVTAANGIVAMAYDTVGENLAYPNGIKVWSKQTEKWITFDIPWLSRVIGWIED